MHRLYSLLDSYNDADAAGRSAIEDQIWQRLGVEKTILSLDMARFSLTVRTHGIVYCLARIRTMQRGVRPVVEAHRGQVIKFEADNLLAAFDQSADAVAAALAIRVALSQMRPAGSAEPLSVCIGIARGRVLVVPEKDAFGDAVNIAYKLGEDLAAADEVLLTDEVHAALAEPTASSFARRAFVISGFPVQTWSSKA